MSGATDYQVGDGKPYTALDQVPWESLKAGDTVRIFHRSTPYKGKFAITTAGSDSAPIRVCGVRGSGNERPVIDGSGATTRATAGYRNMISSDASTRSIHENRTVVLVKGDATASSRHYPQYVQIDGLNITRGHPSYTFTDSTGATQRYEDFGACIWIDRGQNVTIADNEISDCQMAVFSNSSSNYIGDDPGNTQFTVTKNLRVAGNYMWGHGIAGDVHEHTTYIQSVGVTIEFNRYGPLRSGGSGNQLKDRSAGVVVRYNVFEGGAHSMDFVEAEGNFQDVAKPLPSYRETFVYGNLIYNTEGARAIVHYGGDHFGGSATDDTWGELNFRQGTLYFFNNTVYGAGSDGRLFRISTTLETVKAWNNAFYFEGQAVLRENENDGVGSAWTPDGNLVLGVNWIKSGWIEGDPYHPLKGSVTGTGNFLTGSALPFSLTTFAPTAGSPLINVGTANDAGASAHPVQYQLDNSLRGRTRTVNGSAIDLGAKEF